MLKKTFTCIFFFCSLLVYSQEVDPITYQFPINPGQQNYLAGTVGEIRSSHLHTGIDVKTGGRTGLPVHAVADGFISRIKVSPSGYGNTLYIQHPNNTFSVYAHLERFDSEIEKWVLKQQYLKESFNVDLFPKQGDFTFKQGDVIGLTGNTGSSSGPHLHFEIRDSNHQPIDVLSLGFKEIKDRIPPVVKKIAFVTLEEDARVNGYFGRHEFELSKKEGVYTTSIPVNLEGKIGIEIYSYDPMDGIPNKNGIVETSLLIDGDTLFNENKEKLSFSKQRNTLVHYNYGAFKKGRKKFNRLYLFDGNEQDFYRQVNRGITFTNQSLIEIIAKDSYKNISRTKIPLDKNGNVSKTWVPEMETFENFIHFRSEGEVAIRTNKWVTLSPYRDSENNKYFLWDLRKGTPTAVKVNGKEIATNYVSTIPPNQKLEYLQKEFTLNLSHRSLFDTLYLAFRKEYDSTRMLELFHFRNQALPMRSDLNIKLRPEDEYPMNAAVYSVFGNRFNFMGGEWEDKEITFSTRDLVTYTILRDSVPPSIIPRTVNQDNLSFRIKDDLSGIKSFRAEMNGEFVLMYYEPKKNLIWSKKLDKNIPFVGELTLEVIDNSNNSTIYKRTL